MLAQVDNLVELKHHLRYRPLINFT